MTNRRAALAQRAWSLVGLAQIWPRKGGAFRRRLTAGLRYLKSLLREGDSSRIRYCRERELSFDETPVFRFKIRRPRLPCINPMVDFEEEEDDDDDDNKDVDGAEWGVSCEGEGDEGIDSMAEEFISRFYEQMKLQRQASAAAARITMDITPMR